MFWVANSLQQLNKTGGESCACRSEVVDIGRFDSRAFTMGKVTITEAPYRTKE